MVVFSINKYVWISPHYCWLNPNRPSFVLVKRDLPYNVGPPNDSKVCEHNSQKTMRYLEQFVFCLRTSKCGILIYSWSLVWTMFLYVPSYWEFHHPNWLSLHHFSEGLVNHQPVIYTLWIQTLSKKVLHPPNHTPVPLPKKIFGSIGIDGFSQHSQYMNIYNYRCIPSGKQPHNDGKSPFFIGKINISQCFSSPKISKFGSTAMDVLLQRLDPAGSGLI